MNKKNNLKLILEFNEIIFNINNKYQKKKFLINIITRKDKKIFKIKCIKI